jgi:arginase
MASRAIGRATTAATAGSGIIDPMTKRLENLVGALGLALSDTMANSFEGACELSDSAPAALILIRYNPETRIEALARYLELSHSGTVRLVDRLVREGWVAREACDDLRAVVLVLTPAGEKLVEQLVANRSRSIEQRRRAQDAGKPGLAHAGEPGAGPRRRRSHLPALRFRYLRERRLSAGLPQHLMPRPIRIIEAPSPLGLWPSGVERLPEALLQAGLATRLQAETGTKLRRFPLVLGGDCSILVGNALALRRRGTFGLMFLDGHADFYQPEASPTGQGADMDLALVTGRGPAMVAQIDGFDRYFRDDDVALLGFRDGDEYAANGSQDVRDTGILSIDLARLREIGAEAAAEQGLARLLRHDLAGFWIHLDVDVLDDDVMPAVDFRMPGGVSFAELGTLLTAACRTGHCVGMDVTIFNPTLDPDGSIARNLVDCLAAALDSCA